MLYIIGAGPGDPELMTLRGLSIIERCSVVAGWRSVVTRFNLSNKRVVYLNYEEQDRQIRELVRIAESEDVAILVHGDPSVSDYQFMERIRRACEEFGVVYQVIPGVSSVLKALAIVGSDLARVILITFHVRGSIDYSEIDKGVGMGRDLLIIPEPHPDGVRRIAERLLSLGLNPTMVVMERLTFSDEKVHTYTAKEIVDRGLTFSDLSVVYVKLS